MFARVKQPAASASASSTASSSSSTHFRGILDSYASTGLRTLCFGARAVPEKEYKEWSEKMHAANLDIHAREAKLSEAYDLLERDLTLLGCSGIEDKLQPLVPETISELRQAGIKIWMLTGDRWATALEISKSCALYKPRGQGSDQTLGDVLLSIEGTTQEDVRRSPGRCFADCFFRRYRSFRILSDYRWYAHSLAAVR